MAGLGRKEWSPGDTLTAADVNGYLMDQSVMVFAGTAARASAIPSPSAGMVAYSTATNLEYYDGAAWEPIAAASGLTFLDSDTFSAVASVSLPADTFTSTYTNYKVVFVVNAADATRQVFARMRASGSDSTSAIYNNSNGGSNSAGTFVGYGSLSATNWTYPYAGAGGNKLIIVADVSQPQFAEYTFVNGNALGLNGAASQYDGVAVNQMYVAATQFDAMTFFVSTGNMTGNWAVYGYAKS